MNFQGVIIEESLKNSALLQDLKILSTKVEPVTDEHQTPWLPQWTLHTVEIPEERMEEIATKVAQVIENTPSAWYADFKNNQYHFIVYPKKIFKVDLKKPLLYKDASAYGISLGIPRHQVDFDPEDKIWER